MSGNAMTANYGDETDDGVCHHEGEWHPQILKVIEDGVEMDGYHYAIEGRVRGASCGAKGWLRTDLCPTEVEWNE